MSGLHVPAHHAPDPFPDLWTQEQLRLDGWHGLLHLPSRVHPCGVLVRWGQSKPLFLVLPMKIDPSTREALRTWLAANEVSLTRFSLRSHVERVELRKILNGQREYMSLVTAYRIHHTTQGAIPWFAWLPKSVKQERFE